MLLLLACTAAEPAPKTIEEPPCTPVEAIFFDLGETLVTEQDDGLFAEIPEAIALLDALDPDVPTGVITTVPNRFDRDDLAALLVDPALLDRFDVLLLSSEATAPPKPDPAIFVEAVELLSEEVVIERTVFVTEELGDLAEADPPTVGAEAAGMIGVHITTEEPSALADYTLAPADMASLATAAWVMCLEAAE